MRLGVHVVEKFGDGGGPEATDFDASVVFFDGLMEVVGEMHELAFPFSLAHHFDITMQLGLVLLKRQNKVGSPHSQQLSNRFLTAYGIDRDKATRHLEYL